MKAINSSGGRGRGWRRVVGLWALGLGLWTPAARADIRTGPPGAAAAAAGSNYIVNLDGAGTNTTLYNSDHSKYFTNNVNGWGFGVLPDSQYDVTVAGGLRLPDTGVFGTSLQAAGTVAGANFNASGGGITMANSVSISPWAKGALTVNAFDGNSSFTNLWFGDYGSNLDLTIDYSQTNPIALFQRWDLGAAHLAVSGFYYGDGTYLSNVTAVALSSNTIHSAAGAGIIITTNSSVLNTFSVDTNAIGGPYVGTGLGGQVVSNSWVVTVPGGWTFMQLDNGQVTLQGTNIYTTADGGASYGLHIENTNVFVAGNFWATGGVVCLPPNIVFSNTPTKTAFRMFGKETLSLSDSNVVAETNMVAGAGAQFVGNGAGLTNFNGKNITLHSNVNLFLGTAGNYTGTGDRNVAIGDDNLGGFTTARRNTALGIGALSSITTGTLDNAFGDNALNKNTSAQGNNAFGTGALENNTTGNDNTAFGKNALNLNVTNDANVAFGRGALENSNGGDNNTAGGQNALNLNTVGSFNSAWGSAALNKNTTGNANSAFGDGNLQENRTGSENSSFGHNGLLNLTNGTGNASFGSYSGANTYASHYNLFGGYYSGNGITTGSGNVLLGASEDSASYGQVTTGSNNIAIGHNVSVPFPTANNQLVIGNFIYGTGLDGSGATLSSGKIGIGLTNPAYPLDVAGVIKSTGTIYINRAGTDSLGDFNEVILGTGGAWGIRSSLNSSLCIDTFDGSWGQRLRMTPNGHINIGSSDPQTSVVPVLEVTGNIVSSDTIMATNGYGSSNGLYVMMPTNSPTDGQVMTAAGTAGHTKWATSAAGDPLWWTNSAAAASISNNYAVKSASYSADTATITTINATTLNANGTGVTNIPVANLQTNGGTDGMFLAISNATPVWSNLPTGRIVLDVDNSAVLVNNTTVETTLFSNNIPANVMSTNRSVEVTITGTYTNNSGMPTNIYIAAYLGTVTNGFVGTTTISASANPRSVLIKLLVANENSATAQSSHMEHVMGGLNSGGNTPVTIIFAHWASFFRTSVGTTTNVPIWITAKHSGAASTISLGKYTAKMVLE